MTTIYDGGHKKKCMPYKPYQLYFAINRCLNAIFNEKKMQADWQADRQVNNIYNPNNLLMNICIINHVSCIYRM